MSASTDRAVRENNGSRARRILQIGNWPPPVCSWTMSMVPLRAELVRRGWECQVMNLNENRRIKSPEYLDIQNGWDYLVKLVRCVRQGCAIHVRVNGETRKGYFLALAALLAARVARRPALLTYAGGHQQTYFPAPRNSLRLLAFKMLFALPERLYCNSEAVKRVITDIGTAPERVLPIPHFSKSYVEFSFVALPDDVRDFLAAHQGVFFSYVRFRKEYELDFLLDAVSELRKSNPQVGFVLVGAWGEEAEKLRELIQSHGIDDGVLVLGSLPHDYFLTLLSRSLAYVRTPITDGVCSSVLEAMALRVPVIACENGTRPPGTLLYEQGDRAALVDWMSRIPGEREALLAKMPRFVIEDNVKRLVDSIEEVCSSR